MTKIPLLVPTPESAIAQSGVSILQPKTVWVGRPPSMVANLATDLVVPDLSMGRQVGHATYAVTEKNRYLFGFHHLHALVSANGSFSCQEIENYPGRLQFHLSNPPPNHYKVPRITKEQDNYFVDFSTVDDEAVDKLDGFTFFGSPIEPANWGMWLLNGLPSAFAFVAAGQPGRYLCYAPEVWQRNLLAIMGVKSDRIIQQSPWKTYVCEEIAYQQYSHVDLVPDNIAKTVFENLVERCLPVSSGESYDRIFISRKTITKKIGGHYRELTNELELANALAAQGYKTVEPELLSFEEQVMLFRRAKIIVGLGGAGMFNVVFSKPGTRVISIESTGAFILNHARLFSAMGHQYGFVFGQQNVADNRYPHNSWSIDVNAAVRAIVSFE